MEWEWLALAAIAVVFILIGVTWKSPFTRKYWKYALILLPAVVLLIVVLINKRKGTGTADASDELRNAVDKVKDDLHEAQMVCAIEVSAAKAKNAEVIEQLKEVKKITDTQERRRKLAALMG